MSLITDQIVIRDSINIAESGYIKKHQILVSPEESHISALLPNPLGKTDGTGGTDDAAEMTTHTLLSCDTGLIISILQIYWL